MWLLNFIPDEWIRLFIHLLTACGALLYFASGFFYILTRKWLTSIPQAAMALKVIGGVIFVIGVFFEGGYGVEMSWRLRVAEVQAKVASAEKAAAEVNVRLVESENRQQLLQQQLTQTLARKIDQQRAQINQACHLDPAAIQIYNEIVLGKTGSTGP
jgi:hypothetical protein